MSCTSWHTPRFLNTRRIASPGFMRGRRLRPRRCLRRCLRKPRVRAAYDAVREATLRYQAAGAIATATERREMLTAIQRDLTEHSLVRIKAAELHNKMDGLYVTKVQSEEPVPLFVLPAEFEPDMSGVRKELPPWLPRIPPCSPPPSGASPQAADLS